MNFISILNGLFTGEKSGDLKDVKTITNELQSSIKTEEDFLQYAQFKYLLEIGHENFVSSMFTGHAQDDNLMTKMNEIVTLFDQNHISPQIYSYFLYCVLQALKIKTDKMYWVNPYENDLKSQNEGLLKTYGTGLYKEIVYNYEITNNTLKTNIEKRPYVTIPNGITTIEDKAFESDNALEFITFPQSLNTLPAAMLSNCGNLKSIIMTSDVKVIPQNFAKGSKKLSLVVANGIKEIKNKAFEGSSLNTIAFLGGSNLEIIGAEAFANCLNLQKIDISNVAEVHPLAFSGCYNISEVDLTMTSSITANNYKFYSFFETELYNFKRYEHLTKITINVPNGEIPESFFEDCVNVQEIEVIGEIKKIGQKAFKNCYNLKTIKMNYTGNVLSEEVFYACRELQVTPSFKTIEFIENDAFRECASLLKLEFKLIKKLGQSVFQDCANIQEVKFNYEGELLPDYSFSGCYSLRKYDFLKKVKRIGAFALAKMTFVSEFEIPSSITSIQTNAFDNCMFEGVLSIPKNCKINTGAFSRINKITSIIYNNLEIVDLNNVVILPHMIFDERLEVFNEHFPTLVNLKINTNKIEESAFKGWTNIQRVVMDEKVNVIPTSCFEDCINLEGIKINSDNFVIKRNAFANCVNLNKLKTNQTNIEFQSDDIVDLSLASKVEFNAFNKCTGIQQVCLTIKEQNVAEKFKLHSIFEEIKTDIEGKYENLSTVILNLETIVVPDYFFDACQNIVNVKIIGELEEMSEGFFRDCTKLENLEMNYLGSTIPKECFKNCYSLSKLSKFSHVDTIEDEAFYCCGSLLEIKVECEVLKLGRSAFENCTTLRLIDMVFVGDLLPEKCFLNCNNVISFRFLTNITRIESYALSNITFTEDFAVPKKLDYIESYAFANSTFLDTIVLPAAKIINNLAFINVTGFDKIEFNNLRICDSQKIEILPYKIFSDSLEDFNVKYRNVETIFIKTSNICDDTFKDWENIKNVIISPAVKSLPNSCFEGCATLERLKLPYYDIALGNKVFTNCNNLIDVSFTEFDTNSDITNFVPIGTYHNCTKLESISISIDQTVLSSGLKLYSYFEDNLEDFNTKYKKLNSIRIRSKVKEIPESFFEGCINIEKISVFDDISQLNKNAFAHCSNLQELKMKFVGEVIPQACFLGCERLPVITNLKSVKVIEDKAFERCLSITAMQFKTPIESLGVKAFDHCMNLEKINMYYTGEILPALAFGSCEALLNTPRLLKLVFADNSAFEGCINLDSVYINAIDGANFTNIFASSKRITKINFSSQHIPARFFSNLRNVEEVVFEKRLLAIEDSAFEGVKGLTTLRNIDYVESIGDYAFAHSDIEYIKVNARTKYLGVGVFAGCENLKTIEMPIRYVYAGALFDSMNHNSTKRIKQIKHNVTKEFLIPESLELITINDGVFTPGLFSGMDVNVFVNCDVKSIPDYTFYGCKDIVFANPSLITKIGEYAFAYTTINEMNLVNIAEVESSAFRSANMNSLALGDKLTKIANTALQDSTINQLNVAQTENFLTCDEMLVDVQRGIISHVNNISGEIMIPQQVHTLESETFVNCLNVTKIHTNKVTNIQSNAFVNCPKLTSLYIEKDVVNCDEAIIKNCPSVNELFLSFLGKDRKQSKPIEYLFEDLNDQAEFNIISITSGELLPTAFEKCSSIEILDLQKISIKTLEKSTFSNLKINELILPIATTEIKPYAFDHTLVEKITNKGNKAISLVDGAIYCQDRLIYCYIHETELLTIPANIIEIYEGAFQVCKSIKKLEVLNEDIKVNNSFENIIYVDTLTVGNMKENISTMFVNCLPKIEEINYIGKVMKKGFLHGILSLTTLNFVNIEAISFESIENKIDTSKITIDKIIMGESLKSFDVEFFRYINLNQIVITKNHIFKTINNMLIDTKVSSIVYASNDVPADVNIDFKVAKIAEKAFASNPKLESINTGSIVEIGQEAFKDCKVLKDVIINNSCTSIQKDILLSCGNLSNVSVPFVGETIDKTTKISYLFDSNRATPINSVTITNQVVINNTFDSAKNISKVILGEVTTKISSNAFNSCLELKEVEIPKSVTVVENFAFNNCKKKLVAHVYSKVQADAWPLEWRKVNTSKFFASIKVSYMTGDSR